MQEAMGIRISAGTPGAASAPPHGLVWLGGLALFCPWFDLECTKSENVNLTNRLLKGPDPQHPCLPRTPSHMFLGLPAFPGPLPALPGFRGLL